MIEKINDQVFGEMEYNHSWTKRMVVPFLGGKYTVNITAQAYTGDKILDSQRKMFQDFETKINEVIDHASPKIINYCEATFGQNNLQSDDLALALTPRTILFQRDDSWGILFDCQWDVESGIGCFIINGATEVGPQELFL